MLSGKKTKLFWCGIFVIILGGYLLIATISSAFVTYRNYQIYLNEYAAHGSQAVADSMASLITVMTIRSIVFLAIYSALLAIGFYIAKMGIKPPETQTPTVDQTEPALVK